MPDRVKCSKSIALVLFKFHDHFIGALIISSSELYTIMEWYFVCSVYCYTCMDTPKLLPSSILGISSCIHIFTLQHLIKAE